MTEPTSHVIVSGPFDDIRAGDMRFLQEAARLGPLHVLLWNDASLRATTGRDPKFPEAERVYRPRRQPHYNMSDYRAEISLPAWEEPQA